MTLRDDINAEAVQYGAGGSGDFFKFEKAGIYKIRILNKPKVLATHFFGKGVPAVVCVGKDNGCQYHKGDEKRPAIKLVTYIIERLPKEEIEKGKKEEVQLAQLPLSLSYAIDDLQKDDDFSFEEYPMPYDVKITYDPDNDDPKAKYRLQPSPQRKVLDSEEKEMLDEAMKKMTPEQYVEKRKAKQMGKSTPIAEGEGVRETSVEYPDEVDPNDIPFN